MGAALSFTYSGITFACEPSYWNCGSLSDHGIVQVQSQTLASTGWSGGFYSKVRKSAVLEKETDSTLQAIFAAKTIAGLTTFFAKAAVFILYYRIFRLERWMRYAIYLGSAFSFCLYWTNVPLYSYFCAAHDGVWDIHVVERCNTISSFSVIQAAMDIGLSLYIMIIPIPAVFKL